VDLSIASEQLDRMREQFPGAAVRRSATFN
jgi:hypothetical protein